MLGSLLRDLIQRRRHEDEAVELFSRLSKREKGVLALLAEGLDNDAIARELVISPHTARTHVQNVLRKLDVHSRMEAARLALDYNLVERFGSAGDGGSAPEGRSG
jgi:DNA-binding NarL/FixJ family response regulator